MRRALSMVAPQLALFMYGAFPGEIRNLEESFPLSLFALQNVAVMGRMLLRRPAGSASL